MGLLNLGYEHQQRLNYLLSLDFVKILIFAYKQDTLLPLLVYHTNNSSRYTKA